MSFDIPTVVHLTGSPLDPPTEVSSLHGFEARGLSKTAYDNRKMNNLRIVSMSSASASLFAGFIFFYFYFAIHPQRKKFRHKLIFILLVFDFLKALAIIIFPIVTFVRIEDLGQRTINFLGFFTALSTEGGDLAILAFAIHTSLIIFYPRRSGGLYNYRYYYYVSTVLIPLLLASLAFINGVGYSALDVWCYLPVSPIWYRLVLSFGPRYGIMLTILILYFTIYFYIQNQLKKMNRQRKTFDYDNFIPEKVKWWSLGRLFEKRLAEEHEEPQIKSKADIINGMDINIQLQIDNSQRLKTRYKVISRQIRVVFLYPTAYFFLWIFPIISNAVRLNHQAVYAISAITSFINPFNCFVDTFVFFIRERPWKLTYSQTILSPISKMEKISFWRYHLRFLPLYNLPDDVVQYYRHCEGLNGQFFAGLRSRCGQDESKMSIDQARVLELQKSSLNPEEFVNMDTKRLSPSSKGFSSSGTDADNESDGIDLMDFLKQGPPAM